MALLLAVAFALRLAWVLLVPTQPVGDFEMYRRSADHLIAHGALPEGYIFMPGIALLLAGVRWVGGGLLADKLVGAALGALGAGAVRGLTIPLGGRPAGVVAGWLFALWPAGIASASVVGTDMPAAVCLLVALWALVALEPDRPWLAAVACGVALGVGAYLRAVNLALAPLPALILLARGRGFRQAAARGAVIVAVTTLVLSPWIVRNRLHYGEWLVSDSHGGLTAMFGAYPNTDGAYDPVVDTLFREVNGRGVEQGPHRAQDREAYAMARSWAAVSPPYAAALTFRRLQRLFEPEHRLLYWPVYADGVLAAPAREAFVRLRPWLQTLVDGWGEAVLALAALGFGAALLLRAPLWTLAPFLAALASVYALYFAGPRYRVSITALALPLAAFGACWLAGAVEGSVRRDRMPIVAAGVALLSTIAFGAYEGLAELTARTLDRHRWALTRGAVEGRARLWAWTTPPVAPLSPIAGAPDEVTVALDRVRPDAPLRLTARVLGPDLPPGRYRVELPVEAGPACVHVRLPAAARGAPLPDQRHRVETNVSHPGGAFDFEVLLQRPEGAPGCPAGARATFGPPRVWPVTAPAEPPRSAAIAPDRTRS